MDYEIKRLTGKEMPSLIDMLNVSFTGDAHSKHFENGLPKLWIPDDEHMRKNIVLMKDGVIAAAAGVYPYDVSIAGEILHVATVGNIAVRQEYRGKNYMRVVVEEAMRQLKSEGYDASRLGGLRTRYERYGYEPCGTNYPVLLTARNAAETLRKLPKRDFTFQQVVSTDTQSIALIRQWYEKNLIHVKRGNDRDFFATLHAWSHVPYVALCAGRPIGYFCLSADGKGIAEHGAESASDDLEMVCRWLQNAGSDELRLTVYPWDQESCRVYSAVCEGISSSAATHFKIIKWDRVLKALFQLKAITVSVPDGKAVLGIEGYGNLLLCKVNDSVIVQKTDREPLCVLDALTATRFFFGPLPAQCCAPLPPQSAALLAAWLPFPLSWNDQDRV